MYNVHCNIYIIIIPQCSNWSGPFRTKSNLPRPNQEELRGKTLLDRWGEAPVASNMGLGEASISVSVSDESRILSPARLFGPGIAARFYSSLLACSSRHDQYLTWPYTRTQVHTHYYCAGVRFHLPMKISPRKSKKIKDPTFFKFLVFELLVL